jgi:PEP-CTERM motif-containing protein
MQIMTFSNLAPLENDGLYVEDGITATYAGTLNGFAATVSGIPGGIAGFNALYPSTDALFANFTTGALFEPVSVDLRPRGSDYCATGGFSKPVLIIQPMLVCQDSTFDDPITYISFSGLLDGVVISTLNLYMPHSDEFSTISLGNLGVIDTLRIRTLGYFDLGLTGACGPGSTGCGRFDIDNLTVQSVPEPGTLLLLSSALAGAALLRRKRPKFT